MKNFLVIIALVALSCTQQPQNTQSIGDPISPPPPTVTENRCTLVDNGGSTYCAIYKIDGHEYIAYLKGGIIHSESCPCKTNLRGVK